MSVYCRKHQTAHPPGQPCYFCERGAPMVVNCNIWIKTVAVPGESLEVARGKWLRKLAKARKAAS